MRALLPISAYLYTHDPTIFYTPDTASYMVPASQLVTHDRFFSNGSKQSRVWNSPRTPGPEIVRTPGYPLLLTVGLALGRPAIVTVVLQIILSCFTVYLVYLTAGLLFDSERAALIAALLYAIEPLSILFSSLLSTETLFTAVFMIAVYYLVKYMKRESLMDLAAAGAFLAASVYVRPVDYFLPLLIVTALMSWALIKSEKNKLRLAAHMSVFLAVCVGVTGAWQLRNQRVMDYSGFSSVFSEDMYCCLGASVLAAKQNVSYRQMQNRLGCFSLGVYLRQNPAQRNWHEARIVGYMGRDATQIMLDSPFTFARIYFEGVLRGTFDPASTEFIRFFDLYPKHGGLLNVAVDDGLVESVEALLANRLLAWTTLILLVPQFVYLVGAGMAMARREWDRAMIVMLLIVGYYLALPGGPADWGRFRHPAMPIMCALAGYGLAASRRPETKSPRSSGDAEGWDRLAAG